MTNSNKQLNPYYIAGFVAGDGNFNVYINAKGKITTEFKVTQKAVSKTVLVEMMTTFKCGRINIDNRSSNTYKYVVSKKQDLINIIIPFFDKYPIYTSKQLSYETFKTVVTQLSNKQYDHITSTINNKTLYINKNIPFKHKFDYCNNNLKMVSLNINWIAGFIDADGSFQLTLDKRNIKPNYYPTLEIAQNTHDVGILDAIRSLFNSGYIKPKRSDTSYSAAIKVRSLSRYINRDYNKVIAILDKCNLVTSKKFDYFDWKRAIKIKYNIIHSNDPIADITTIKNGMNKNRYV